jgi:hypothetical protein
MRKIPMPTRRFVHKLKYDGGDCISEHLRVLFPALHSSFCDDAVVEVVNHVAATIEQDDECDCDDGAYSA